MSFDHFQGKSVVEHLKEARAKGATASVETHGIEMPGHLAAGADACKETGVALLLLFPLLLQLPISSSGRFVFLVVFCAAWIIWKMGRSAALAWARLERLHRAIEEERSEIAHHRQQEKEELTALYRAKGFSGNLLEQVINVLMADDNRLLRVMLEEELGLTLEIHEHPLKQAMGAGLGALGMGLLALLGLWIAHEQGLFVLTSIGIGSAAYFSAKLEKNRPLPAVVWNIALSLLCSGFSLFLSRLILF